MSDKDVDADVALVGWMLVFIPPPESGASEEASLEWLAYVVTRAARLAFKAVRTK